MNKQILVISTQYPGHGGASTNAYAIIKFLRQNNYNVIGIFIENDTNTEIDPENLGNIYHFPLYPLKNGIKNNILEHKKKLNAIFQDNPSIIICKNYLAPIYAKILYPTVKNLYFVSGLSNAIKLCDEIPASVIVSNNIILPQTNNEILAIKNSDLIVINSMMTYQIFINSYSEYKDKLYPKIIDTSKYATLLINDGQTFEKKYDFIIAASILTRKEKNNEFLIDVLNNPMLEKYSKLIIGNDNDQFIGISNATIYDAVSHDILMNLMKRSKIFLTASLYDSNPNTIREAVYNKCLILMSNNIGYYEFFPEISVCKTYDHMEWINKSIYLVDHYNEIIKNYYINFDLDMDGDNMIELINKLI